MAKPQKQNNLHGTALTDPGTGLIVLSCFLPEPNSSKGTEYIIKIYKHYHFHSNTKAVYTQQKKKRTTTTFPFRHPFNKKMLIVMKYSFLIKFYENLSVT